MIGLLFGFDEETGARGFANPIQFVLAKLNVSMGLRLPALAAFSTAAVAPSSLTSCVLSGDQWRVYYIAENYHVIELGWSEPQGFPLTAVHFGYWSGRDVTGSAGQDTPAPLSGSPLTSCALGHDDWTRVNYVAEDPHHVIELG